MAAHQQLTQSADTLYRAHARLTSLQQLLTNNLSGGFVGEQYVAEYHSVLDQLERAGFDLSEFRISPSLLERRSTGGNYLTGEVFYSKEREVQHGLFLMKLQAVLSYFSLTTQSPPKRIGFTGPPRN